MLPFVLGFRLILLFLHGADGKENCHCVTQGCVLAAANLLNSIDTHVDPCQNFYQFACGKWKRDNHIPDDASSYGPFMAARNRVALQLRTLLEDDSDENSTTNSIRFTKALYKSCMDLDQIEYLKSTPIHSFLNEIGGWPVINNTWKDNPMDLTSLSILMKRQFGKSFLIDDGVLMDWKNETNNILMVSQTSPVLTRDFYLNDAKYGSKMNAYKELFVGVVNLIASDMNISIREDIIDSHWSRLIDFERQLANITIPPQEQENISLLYNKFTIANFSALIHVVNWELYYESTMPVEVFERLVKRRTDRFIFIVWHPKFYRNFNELLSSATKDKEDKQEANILVNNLKESFKNIIRHTKWMDNVTQTEAIEKASNMIDLIGYPDFIVNDSALENYYANLSYKRNASFLELHRVIVHWKTRKEYFDLLKSFARNEFKVNPATVNAYYDPTENSITFPAAILQPPFFHYDYPKYVTYGLIGAIIGHEVTHGFDSTGHQFDKIGSLKNWWSHSSKENFDKQTKCIRNQYGEYVEPLTLENVDGNLTVGENIADNGGVRNALSAYKEYVERRSKDEKPLPGLNLTVHQTFFASYALQIVSTDRQSQITPDYNLIVILKFYHRRKDKCYDGYFSHCKPGSFRIRFLDKINNSLDKITPLTPHPEHLYACVIGQSWHIEFWCENRKKEQMQSAIKSDEHSPSEFRVNGPLSNIPEFAEAYACPKGSPMFPDKRCSVW